MAKRWINSLDVEVGPNGAPLFDMAGCLSFVGGTKTVSSTATPQALVAVSTPCRFVWIGARVNSDGNPKHQAVLHRERRRSEHPDPAQQLRRRRDPHR